MECIYLQNRLDTRLLYSQRLEHSLKFGAYEIPLSAKQVLGSSQESGGRMSNLTYENDMEAFGTRLIAQDTDTGN